MSDSYVAVKTREALALADGSRARAQRILLAWSRSDDRLFRELAAPFMKGIVSNAVERAARSGRLPERPQRQLAPKDLDRILAAMGQREGGAPRPAAPETGQAGALRLGTVNAPPPTKAGERHVRTIKALAAMYRQRRES